MGRPNKRRDKGMGAPGRGMKYTCERRDELGNRGNSHLPRWIADPGVYFCGDIKREDQQLLLEIAMVALMRAVFGPTRTWDFLFGDTGKMLEEKERRNVAFSEYMRACGYK